MRVRAGQLALHADRALEHARLAALASVRALLPTQPSNGRCMMVTPPLKTACGTEPRQRRAPHPRGVSSRLAASPCRVERPERRGRQQRGGQRAPAPREGKFGKNNCHNIGKAKRSRSDLRGCGAESLLGIDESTQEKGLRANRPIWYQVRGRGLNCVALLVLLDFGFRVRFHISLGFHVSESQDSE